MIFKSFAPSVGSKALPLAVVHAPHNTPHNAVCAFALRRARDKHGVALMRPRLVKQDGFKFAVAFDSLEAPKPAAPARKPRVKKEKAA